MFLRAKLSVLALYNFDNTIFDGLQLPDGVDHDTAVYNLLMECSELETVYPDPDFTKGAIAAWSAMCMPTWQKMYDTTQFEYNPIWNKDGTYKELETRNLKSSGSNVNDTMGYNSSSWTHSDQSTSGGTDTGTIAREHTEQGNIGVTTTQEMIRQEREVAQFNFIQYFIDEFKKRFCILVY